MLPKGIGMMEYKLHAVVKTSVHKIYFRRFVDYAN